MPEGSSRHLVWLIEGLTGVSEAVDTLIHLLERMQDPPFEIESWGTLSPGAYLTTFDSLEIAWQVYQHCHGTFGVRCAQGDRLYSVVSVVQLPDDFDKEVAVNRDYQGVTGEEITYSVHRWRQHQEATIAKAAQVQAAII